MLSGSLSKPASNFVRKLRAVGPDRQHVVVRDLVGDQAWSRLLHVLQLLKDFGCGFDVHNTKAALHIEWHFDNNFSHGSHLSTLSTILVSCKMSEPS